MSPYLITAIVALFAALIIRRHWINYHFEAYTFKSLYFIWKAGKTPEVASEMSQMWPMRYMLFELWRWDFARYIIHQDHYEEMEEFTKNESNLTQGQLLAALDEIERREAEKHTSALAKDDADRDSGKDDPTD